MKHTSENHIKPPVMNISLRSWLWVEYFAPEKSVADWNQDSFVGGSTKLPSLTKRGTYANAAQAAEDCKNLKQANALSDSCLFQNPLVILYLPQAQYMQLADRSRRLVQTKSYIIVWNAQSASPSAAPATRARHARKNWSFGYSMPRTNQDTKCSPVFGPHGKRERMLQSIEIKKW